MNAAFHSFADDIWSDVGTAVIAAIILDVQGAPGNKRVTECCC